MSVNQKTLAEIENDLISSKRSLMTFKEEMKRKCNHKPNNKGHVVNVHDSNIIFPGKKDLPETTVICTRCEKFFESCAYNPEELESAFYALESSIEQTKLNANLSDEDWEAIGEAYTSIDSLRRFVRYYNNMVNKLHTGGNKKNRDGKAVTKGHIGVRQNMFNSKNY